MRLGGRSFGNGPDAFARLHQQIRGMVNDAGGPGTASDLEIELDCDYDLNYEYVMRAITAITGYIENGDRTSSSSASNSRRRNSPNFEPLPSPSVMRRGPRTAHRCR